MKIKRGKKEYTLTQEELYQAHKEFVTKWMQEVLQDDFQIPEERAEELAQKAYDKYSEGNGETEYECVAWAAEQKKQYFKVNYQVSEHTWSANVAYAYAEDDVKKYYQKLSDEVIISAAKDWEVKSAIQKGMPIIEIGGK